MNKKKFSTLRWRRKLTAFSATTYVALPVVWLENMGLHRKDPVDLELLSDGSLRLLPSDEEATHD